MLLSTPDTTAIQNPLITIITEQNQAEPEPKKTTYKIKENDSLEKIAKKYDTTWLRLFYKNEQIKHPDQLEVGVELTIPEPDEKLKERLYTIETPNIATSTQTSVRTAVNQSKSYASSGWFPVGQCTWWVSTKRSVGQWNNATDWLWQAKRDGYATGSQPRAGAIAWKVGHVAYIESVSGNRMVVSEANYDYNGSIRTIEVPVSSYSAFIY